MILLSGADLVLPDRVLTGTLAIEGERIVGEAVPASYGSTMAGQGRSAPPRAR